MCTLTEAAGAVSGRTLGVDWLATSACEYVGRVEEDAPSFEGTVVGLGRKEATIASTAAL
jgi:hypothetical protein